MSPYFFFLSVRSDTLCDIRQTGFMHAFMVDFVFINPEERSHLMSDRKSVNEKVDELSAGISDTVHDLIREAKPMIHNATDRMSDRVNDLTKQSMDAVRKGQHEMAHVGHDISDRATQMIRNEPFKAMLIAAGVGASAVALVGLMARTHPHHQSQH